MGINRQVAQPLSVTTVATSDILTETSRRGGVTLAAEFNVTQSRLIYKVEYTQLHLWANPCN